MENAARQIHSIKNSTGQGCPVESSAKQVHPFDPIFDRTSKILILGTFPSVKSRENAFYYGNPQNRFWKVLAAVLHCSEPQGNEEKTTFLLDHHIALWDVIRSCEITGSDDSSIRNAIPNNLEIILSQSAIRQIYTNGKTAERLYRQYIQPSSGREAVSLPSTSPANAAYSLGRLILQWDCIREK